MHNLAESPSSWSQNKLIKKGSLKRVIVLDKYYCENCRLLYDDEVYCTVCGELASKKIKIEVQKQPEK